MAEHHLVSLASIVLLGISAQWLAWRLHLPSILLLLIFGFIAGDVVHLIEPDKLFGDLLFPAVSLAVATILFEGGLSLKLRELRDGGRTVARLVTVGALATLVISIIAAYILLGLDLQMAVLLGSILVVTGPTVIIPLLRHVRPLGRVGPILRWEGIVIDPIGAMLAVLVFEAILVGEVQAVTQVVISGVLKTLFIGVLVGTIGAGIIIVLLKRYLVPDFLQSVVVLTTALAAFTASNLLQSESGLVAVTLMGIILANQYDISLRHIIEFKENLRVLLISSLFIVLAARLRLSDFLEIGLSGLLFLGVLILVARPVSVLFSTYRSGLGWRDRLFLAWMAPRGIVAAAVASIFALRLEQAGNLQAERLVPLTFLVIVGTVMVYGLTAMPVAQWLGVSRPNPQGTLIVGAHPWARAIARALVSEGFQVLLIDTNDENVRAARAEALPANYSSILWEDIHEEVDLGGIGRLIALTSNDEVNSLAALHFAEIFGRSQVYQLAPHTPASRTSNPIPIHLRGRLLFGSNATYEHITRHFDDGASIKNTRLTERFDYAAFRTLYGSNAVPLFLVNEQSQLLVSTDDREFRPRAGHTIISLVSGASQSTT